MAPGRRPKTGSGADGRRPSLDDVITLFFELQDSVKLFHWLTPSYAQHKAADALSDALSDLTDKFVEVYIGRFGRPQSPNAQVQKTTNVNINAKEFAVYVAGVAQRLEAWELTCDLASVRDELVAAAHQCIYLLSLA